MEDDKKQKIFLAGLLVVGIIAVYFKFLLNPKIHSLILYSGEVRQMLQKVNEAENEIAVIPKNKQKIADLKEKISFNEKNMPTKKEIPALLGELSSFAQSANVKILAIQPYEKSDEELEISEKKKEPYFEVPIRIEARAAYHNLGVFINKLETADRFMKITDLRIESNIETPALQSIRLFISTYVLPEEEKKE